MADRSEALSGLPTMGVEEEFLLLDDRGHLAGESPEVLALAADGASAFQHELTRYQVESASTVVGDSHTLLRELRLSRERLSRAAAAKGLRLVAVGTPLLRETAPPALSPVSRYARMRDELGPALLESTSTCGCHVHIAVPDLASGLRAANHLRPWLPALLALTANSPYSDGRDTGYASWRYIRWSRQPAASAQPFFADEREYRESVEALLASGAVLDKGMLYWDARPSEVYPTLEVRVSDVAATAEEAVLLAVLVRGLVTTFLADAALGLPPPCLRLEVLRAHMWRAARDGLDGRCLDPATGRPGDAREVLPALVDRVRPVLERSGDLRFVESMLGLLYTTGSGARRQRELRARCAGTGEFVDRLAETTVGGPFHTAHGGSPVG
ncbi:carboxylate-amine ligase [Actinorugispora endophytica]|uniref:Putative glutamate--cysteine ligase 2 n=1 Tax=Actinorugispora endophytica TaxID=1605990 RepID=A0A4R6UHI8_9ACTN|nr:glutamate--cysteine ligase [Actinorugispora endophytica]TDQ46330.1 carboxylate-amine ligase [Actinorugispora endophytica]